MTNTPYGVSGCRCAVDSDGGEERWTANPHCPYHGLLPRDRTDTGVYRVMVRPTERGIDYDVDPDHHTALDDCPTWGPVPVADNVSYECRCDAPRVTRIKIDPNVRVGGDQTYAALEDIEGPEPELGDLVEVHEPEGGAWGTARVAGIDYTARLIYLTVDWSTLAPLPLNDRLRRGIEQAERGETVDRGDFTHDDTPDCEQARKDTVKSDGHYHVRSKEAIDDQILPATCIHGCPPVAACGHPTDGRPLKPIQWCAACLHGGDRRHAYDDTCELEPCCGSPDACCGCTCPPQEDDEDERRVADDCGVHGTDGCIAAGLVDRPAPPEKIEWLRQQGVTTYGPISETTADMLIRALAETPTDYELAHGTDPCRPPCPRHCHTLSIDEAADYLNSRYTPRRPWWRRMWTWKGLWEG